MDFFHLAKQLQHEIAILETQVREKKAARDKLVTLLTPAEKSLLEVEALPKPPPTKPPGR
jgi:hypothetical protein